MCRIIVTSHAVSPHVTRTLNVETTLNPITGTATVCVGNATTLANTTYSGVWSSSNTSVATIGSTGIVNGVSVGTTTISYITPCGSATAVVTVNPTPTVTVNSPTMCSGNTATLTANGGTTYSWTPSTGLSATNVAQPIANPSSTTTYTVTGTNINGCTSTATVTVTVNTSPSAITGGTNICVAATTTLSSSPTGGTWSSTNTGVATIGSTGIVLGVSTGSTVISYVLSSGCFTGISTVVRIVGTRLLRTSFVLSAPTKDKQHKAAIVLNRNNTPFFNRSS